jgi:hypothetical protein
VQFTPEHFLCTFGFVLLAKCTEIFRFLKWIVRSNCVYLCYGFIVPSGEDAWTGTWCFCVSFDRTLGNSFEREVIHAAWLRPLNESRQHVGMLSRIRWRVAFARSTEFRVFPECSYKFCMSFLVCIKVGIWWRLQKFRLQEMRFSRRWFSWMRVRTYRHYAGKYCPDL